MSSTPPSGGRLLVEPLEARIAPTGLTAIANDPINSGSAANYVTYGTQPSANHLGFVPATTYLGAGAPANLFAIKLTGDGSVDSTGLSTGDKLLIFNSTTGFNPSFPSLQATDKTLIAFFQDRNGDGQVQSNELVGISLTKNSGANINGNVYGDIVTNLFKDGSAINLSTVYKPSYTIAGLNINGNVFSDITATTFGNILGGGNINNVSVRMVGNVLAGTATDGHTYNFTGNPGVVTGTIAEGAFKAGKVGASITGLNVNMFAPGGTVHAGDGGLGAVGGGVADLTVLADTAGFNVIAGNGGIGTDTFKGGVGGQISDVTVVGVAGAVNNSLINFHAGNGGEDDAFKGGTGGSISGVATNFSTGFNTDSNTGTLSPDFLTQNIIAHAGDGGVGLKGGKGGDVVSSSIFSAAPDDTAVVNGLANPEIQVIAGHGGLPIAADQGHGGKGGNISLVNAQDQFTDVTTLIGTTTTTVFATDSVLVQAGDGAAGKDGGSVSNVNVLGAEVVINAGNGGDGINSGGPGGSLQTVNILNLSNLFTHELTLNAGSGGASSAGSGGVGGSINTVSMLDSDLFNIPANPNNGLLAQSGLVINSGTHGNGGTGSNGVGGAGGQIMSVQLQDSNASGGFATVAVRSGAGGNGSLGGGDGGGIGTSTAPVQMFGLNFSYTVTAGVGGTVLPGGTGAGGMGGSLDTVGFSNVPNADTMAVGVAISTALGGNYGALTGVATAGGGGAGTTQGGAGGGLSGVDLRAGFDIAMTAGDGGTGGTGSAGAGGAVAASAGVSLGGAVSIVAGNAAGGGSFSADGGTITGAIASAQTNVVMTAGNGGVGGNGGSIVSSGTTNNPLYVDPTFTALGGEVDLPTSNFGNVTITAGNGSSANGVAGVGGSVTAFNGSIGLGGAGDFSNFNSHLTKITAGNGGGGVGQTASGAGGSVTSLQLTGNNLVDIFGQQFVTVDGGDAISATAAKRGAAGGDVSTATIFNLDAGTVVQHLAAGDGASALKRGGAGGSLTEIHVGRAGDLVADIGLRSGAAFGYAVGGAGGLFAGVGGTGSKSIGVNGDVTNVTAAAVSSIVALDKANPGVIHLANVVDGIDLAGNTPPVANADGSFTNFDTAILVGSIQDPTAAGASTFKPGDGLVAATNFTSNRDFFPEAILTYNTAGVLQFFDLREPNTDNPVVTTTIPFSFAI